MVTNVRKQMESDVSFYLCAGNLNVVGFEQVIDTYNDK